MCAGCWEEEGSPQIDTPEVRAAAAAVREVYLTNCVGGNLHILVDDWNAGDESLEFLESAIEDNYHERCEGGLAAERECLRLMKGLTEAERYSALALEDGLWGGEQ